MKQWSRRQKGAPWEGKKEMKEEGSREKGEEAGPNSRAGWEGAQAWNGGMVWKGLENAGLGNNAVQNIY